MKNVKDTCWHIVFFLSALILVQCSSDSNSDSGSDGSGDAASLSTSLSQLFFEPTSIDQYSSVKTLTISYSNLTTAIQISSSSVFEVSLDGVAFSNSIVMPIDSSSNLLFVRFAPLSVDRFQGEITIQNTAIATDLVITISGAGTPRIQNYQTFSRERLAFGTGFSQSAVHTFNLPSDVSNFEAINMYVKLTCPSGGCDEWDVFANVKVLDPLSGELYELARFITPYWNDNSQLPRGFEFDVTDFKSLLTGSVSLRIMTECWNVRGYEVSVDFDYVEGMPDYAYYEIARLFNYDNNSLAGIPYGVTHSFDLTRTVNVPSNAQSTHLRTVISGWGQTASGDPDGRPCAEWCFRTHQVLIDGATMFQHDLAPLGCASNPVSNQAPGNWMPDRAGWCPGMEVPTRIDVFSSNRAGTAFNFEYELENWINMGGSNAFYAISTFVVVKSDTPIQRPVVMD
ncbi:MAG: peptide-N-glycosidase F-related protein [Nonlabens sp.]|uniref:peptide-N-glycosidase F-related protein n=1 Tax=Nonlabens sp. TaxID=1888209 RepID=UPI0035A6BBAC